MVKIKKLSKKSLFAVAIILILVIGSALYFGLYRNNSQKVTQNPGGDTVNLDPPTKEDAERVEQNKQAIVEREQKIQNQQPTSGKKSVKPVITYAGQYGSEIEVGGYVPGVFEDTGSCTARFTNGSNAVIKSVKAVKNVNSTDCPVMAAQSSEFSPKGSWSVNVSYDSPSANGSSDTKTIEVK